MYLERKGKHLLEFFEIVHYLRKGGGEKERERERERKRKRERERKAPLVFKNNYLKLCIEKRI